MKSLTSGAAGGRVVVVGGTNVVAAAGGSVVVALPSVEVSFVDRFFLAEAGTSDGSRSSSSTRPIARTVEPA